MSETSQQLEPVIGKEYPGKVIPLIKKAKKSLDILVYDWRWYEDQPGAINQKFNLEILEAVKRKVKVRALLNTPNIANILRTNGVEARVKGFERVLHTKIIIIDEEIVILGSHNLTKNAFEINFEASAIIKNPEFAAVFQDYFNSLYG